MTAVSNLSLGRRAMALVEELARHTDEPGRLTRLYLSPAHRRAAERRSEDARGRPRRRIDAAGSVVGRLAGATRGARDPDRLAYRQRRRCRALRRQPRRRARHRRRRGPAGGGCAASMRRSRSSPSGTRRTSASRRICRPPRPSPAATIRPGSTAGQRGHDAARRARRASGAIRRHRGARARPGGATGPIWKCISSRGRSSRPRACRSASCRPSTASRAPART